MLCNMIICIILLLEVQSKLLRVLQSGEYSRVGGNENLHSDVRILAATNKQLEEEVEHGTFREDLFYRLNVVRIHIPPLRRRREDVRLLAEHFLQKQTEKGRNRPMQFSIEAVDVLEEHHWPGNVRELENLVQRACVLASGNVLFPSDLPFDSKSKREEDSRSKLERAARRFLNAALENEATPVEIAMRQLVRAAMEDSDQDSKAAAKTLGMSVPDLRKYLPSGGEKS